MKNLIIVPHQDDEVIGCWKLLKSEPGQCKVVIVVKGGGASKKYPWLTQEQLYQIRCLETRTACAYLGVSDVTFLGVERPLELTTLQAKIQEVLQTSDFERVLTTSEHDLHPDHVGVFQAVHANRAWLKGRPLLTFIVQTDRLRQRLRQCRPDLSFKLTREEYQAKKDLIRVYRTQNHFLPQVIARRDYREEHFWEVR